MPWTMPDFGKLGQQDWQPAKLGPTDLFKAPKGTAFDAVNKWVYLGRLKPGSYKNNFKRQFYDLVTGVPETAKETFVIGIEGTMEASLIEMTSEAYLIASGNNKRTPMFGTVPVTDPVVAGSTTDTVKMTDGTKFPIGTEIEVPLPGGILAYTFVIGNAAPNDLYVYPKLSAAPAAAATVKKVRGWRFKMGGVTVDRHALRAVANFTDGFQLVTHAGDVRSDGVAEDFKDNKTEVEIPLMFTLFGVTDPDADVTGPIVATKYILGPDLALSYD